LVCNFGHIRPTENKTHNNRGIYEKKIIIIFKWIKNNRNVIENKILFHILTRISEYVFKMAKESLDLLI